MEGMKSFFRSSAKHQFDAGQSLSRTPAHVDLFEGDVFNEINQKTAHVQNSFVHNELYVIVHLEIAAIRDALHHEICQRLSPQFVAIFASAPDVFLNSSEAQVGGCGANHLDEFEKLGPGLELRNGLLMLA
jgi:hypothetical protein